MWVLIAQDDEKMVLELSNEESSKQTARILCRLQQRIMANAHTDVAHFELFTFEREMLSALRKEQDKRQIELTDEKVGRQSGKSRRNLPLLMSALMSS